MTEREVTDIILCHITALFLGATPDFVIPSKFFSVPENVGGELFCRLIASTYILFTFGKASSLTVMCMAVERWYAVVKPMRYKATFRKRRLGLYVTIVWIFSCFTQINELFQMTSQGGHCTPIEPPYGRKISQMFTVFHIALTFYVPSIVTWITFTDVWLSMRKSRKISAHCCMTNYGVAKQRIVRMCAITAFVLTLCWFPAETFYILLTFKTLVLPFGFYQFTIVLAMFNSCVNPVVYCLSNQEYKRDFISLFTRHCDQVKVFANADQAFDKSLSIQTCRKSTLNEEKPYTPVVIAKDDMIRQSSFRNVSRKIAIIPPVVIDRVVEIDVNHYQH